MNLSPGEVYEMNCLYLAEIFKLIVGSTYIEADYYMCTGVQALEE